MGRLGEYSMTPEQLFWATEWQAIDVFDRDGQLSVAVESPQRRQVSEKQRQAFVRLGQFLSNVDRLEAHLARQSTTEYIDKINEARQRTVHEREEI